MPKLLALVLMTVVFAPQEPAFHAQDLRLLTGRAQEPLLLMKEEVFTATVREVVDGDSLLVKEGPQNIRIHLDGIDAPELAQAVGAEAKTALGNLVDGQTITVRLRRRGRGGEEALARVDSRGVDLSVELLRRGMAWYCPRQVDDAEMVAAEKSAREAKRGVWSDASPTPPWRHRGVDACWQERVGS